MLNLKSTGVLCEGCRSSESAVYCRTDSAYLCINCDSRIHTTALHHERFWLCESCVNAPAVFLCKADSASLCVDCDSSIHSANLLAGRHHRIPIQPIPENIKLQNSDVDENDDDEEAASWLLLNPLNGRGGIEEGSFLELGDFESCTNFDQCSEENSNQMEEYNVPQAQREWFQLGLEYEEEQKEMHFFSTSSFHQTSDMIGERSSKVSSSEIKEQNVGGSDQMSSCVMDREARVLRYREKKKNRRFEKTIRYASRKAYAEVRPRIKGRFAKQTDRRCNVNMIFTSD